MNILFFLYLTSTLNKLSKSTINPQIDSSWKDLLIDDFNSESFLSLKQFLLEEKKKHSVYPPGKLMFAAFDHALLSNLKVVIIGQDPYHGKGQAHGLSFSVPDGIKPPPSLKNIFKELKSDLNINVSETGNLEKWADQGVLLLNATLSVRASSPGSHQGKGWEQFTDAVISKISDKCDHLVFLLWGRFAQAKSDLIDHKKHLILTSAHPSPFSAHNGFFGCRHFSKTNAYLESKGIDPINWDLNE